MSGETATSEKESLTAEAKRLEALMDQLSPGDRIIVYRVQTDEQTKRQTHSVKTTLRDADFRGIEDLEVWLSDTATTRGWPSGEYVLDHRKQGKNGSCCRRTVWIDPETPKGATVPGTPATGLSVKEAKELFAVPQASPDAALSAVTAAVKIGAESAAKPNTNGETLLLLKPVLEKLVDRLMAPAAAAPDPLVQMRSMVGALRELGLIGDQGGAPEEAKSLREQLTEVKELAEALGLSARGGASEATAVQIAKVLAPVAEKVVPQILATVNNLADVWRLRMMATGGPMGGPAPRAMPAAPPAMVAGITNLAHAAQAAITRDDDGFFGPFVDGIAQHVPDGRAFLLAIQSGQVEEEQALAAIGTTELLNPADPATRAWLLRCVHWIQTRKPMAAGPTDPARPTPSVEEIRGRCDKCSAEYTFPGGLAEYQADTRICDAPVGEGASADELCKGNIVLAESTP